MSPANIAGAGATVMVMANMLAQSFGVAPPGIAFVLALAFAAALYFSDDKQEARPLPAAAGTIVVCAFNIMTSALGQNTLTRVAIETAVPEAHAVTVESVADRDQRQFFDPWFQKQRKPQAAPERPVDHAHTVTPAVRTT